MLDTIPMDILLLCIFGTLALLVCILSVGMVFMTTKYERTIENKVMSAATFLFIIVVTIITYANYYNYVVG